MPDLIGYWLTGEAAAEETNASTTGLLDAATREWAWDLIETLALPRACSRRCAGRACSGRPAEVAEETGLAEADAVTHVGSHDTASAVVAVPAGGPRFAYVACGTWSLVGVELEAPVLTEASRAANFTNEAGVDGRVRYLRNVMGLWLLQESLRTWERRDDRGARSAAPAGGRRCRRAARSSIPDEPVFLPPGRHAEPDRGRVPRPGSPAGTRARQSSAASSTAWPRPTRGPSRTPRGCRGSRSRRSTSSAVEPATSCCAS